MCFLVFPFTNPGFVCFETGAVPEDVSDFTFWLPRVVQAEVTTTADTDAFKYLIVDFIHWFIHSFVSFFENLVVF
jgi:hypothetical protein